MSVSAVALGAKEEVQSRFQFDDVGTFGGPSVIAALASIGYDSGRWQSSQRCGRKYSTDSDEEVTSLA